MKEEHAAKAAAFAAMTAALGAGDDAAMAAVLASEMSSLAANGKPRPALPSPLDILTPAAAAAYLQVPEEVVLQEATAGRLPGRCLGGQWRFLHKAITDWLQIDITPDPTATIPARSKAGAGRDFDEDPEEVIAKIYAERRKKPVRG